MKKLPTDNKLLTRLSETRLHASVLGIGDASITDTSEAPMCCRIQEKLWSFIVSLHSCHRLQLYTCSRYVVERSVA